MNTRKFAGFLVKENPDVIITTHFLTAEIAAGLKKLKKITSGLVTVITDFGVHFFWISSPTDLYIVASVFTKDCLVREGIAGDSIKILGIPVDSKFLRNYNKEELCQKFAIDKNKFTVLLMTGSFGLGPLEDIAEALYKDVQILVVCAANKKLYERLKKKDLPAVKVFGFVDNAQELMAVSDVIITKPGGLTISEVLCMELAPIFISSIPGQEAINAKVLEEYGIGISAKRIEEAKDIVLDYRDHPDKLKNIKDKIRQIRRPNTLKDICNVICQGSIGGSGPRPL
jgi:processive 1,2-diacylglycerol beta-glucosyltransferase